MSTTYGYSIRIPAPAGVDAERYVVTLGVYRRNGASLSKAEVEALESALAPLVSGDTAPVGDSAVAAAAQGKADRRQAATVAKVAGDKATKSPGKGKPAGKSVPGTKPRKASKATPRKAARRPAKG